MATITTSTANTPTWTWAFGYPPNSMMDINVKTGELWICFKDQANRAAVYKSSDNGGSWSLQGTWNVSPYTLEDICEMRIDSAGENMHIVLMASTGSAEVLQYKRIDISSGAIAGPTGSVTFSGPAGTNQSLIYGGACVPVKNPDGSFHIFLAAAQHNSTSSGVRVYVMTVRNDGAQTTLVNDAVIGPTRQWRTAGDDTSMTVSLDVEHNGDGITSATPNVWVTWLQGTYLYTVRCTWKGYRTGWQTPSSPTLVAGGRNQERDALSRWDGQHYVIASLSPYNLAQMQLIERNSSNTGTVATRTSPSYPLGNIAGARMLSYNHVTKDIRIFAASTSGTAPVYYVDWFRATDSWGSWVAAGISPLASEWGVRRGTYGTAQYDLYALTGASSPWTVSNLVQAVNFSPTAPTWVIGGAGMATQNGAAFDVTMNLTLDWEFHDPNSTDTQSAYALQRQIGGGTVQWWRTSDNTWQTSETWNSTATTQVVLTPAQWVGGGGAADPAHVYKVATKDSGGSIISPYSVGLSIVPSTRADPSVTTPTTGSVLNSGVIPVTWTVSEQSQWRVQIVPSIVTDTFTRTVSSGWGSSDNGLPWTITGATPNSDYSVASGAGKMSHASSGLSKSLDLTGVTVDNFEVLLLGMFPSSVAVTSNFDLGFCGRVIDNTGNNLVEVKVFWQVGGAAPSVFVQSITGGVSTASGFVIADSSLSTTATVNVRFRADANFLYARMWGVSNPEPTQWHVMCASTHNSAGWVKVRSATGASNTSTKPLVFSIGDVIMVDGSLKTYDSGFVADQIPSSPVTLAHTPPTVFPDGYQGVVTLQTKNLEGLASQIQTIPISIDFVEPVSPLLALAAAPASGGINVTTSQAAASGTQPVTDRIDIYRRKVLSGTVTPANANPYFETNANDWTNSGYSTAARSTVQAHTGTASILLTPNASTATPKVQTTALYAVTAGSRWEFRGWLRSTTANKTMRVYIDWYDNTPTLLGSTVRDLTPVAGVWVFAWVRGTAPANTTQARIAVGQLATPAAGDTLYGDELGLYAANDDNGIAVFRDVITGLTYLDWRAVTGVDYEYQGVATATNGTVTYGPWIS